MNRLFLFFCSLNLRMFCLVTFLRRIMQTLLDSFQQIMGEDGEKKYELN